MTRMSIKDFHSDFIVDEIFQLHPTFCKEIKSKGDVYLYFMLNEVRICHKVMVMNYFHLVYDSVTEEHNKLDGLLVKYCIRLSFAKTCMAKHTSCQVRILVVERIFFW